MALSFFETMTGTLVEPSGKRHLVNMDLGCEATKVRAMLRTGEIRLTGIIRARPWADDMPLDGTLRVSPIRGRKLEYDVRFKGDDGRSFRLFGQKDLGWRSPMFGLTRLGVELTSEGATLARGDMSFSLNDLPRFAASWSSRSTIGRVDAIGATPRTAPGPAVGVAQTNARQRELLLAFGEAIIHPTDVVPPVDTHSVALASELLGHLPPHVQSLYRGGLFLLDTASRARHRKGFDALDVATRRDLLAQLPGDATFAIGAPLKTAHFSRREFLDAIGAPDYANPVRENTERWMSQVLTADDLDAEATIPCDVVIVGTGAGGAPLAAKLAERGFAVALVEAGQYHRRPQFAGGPEERLMRFWKDGGMNIAVGNCPVVVPTGKMVGGSTAINSGTCLQTPDAVLAEWRAEGFPADFAPDQFARWTEEVRAELQVQRGQQPWLGAIAERIAEGAEDLRAQGVELQHGALPRNAPGCDGQGLCPVGCPTGAKRSSDVSWVPRALRAGAQCFTGLTVRRILMRGSRAVAVEARGQDRFGVSRTLRLKARAVVLACGTLETPLLLRRNGFDLPRLGRGLSVHPAIGAFAMFDDSLGEPWRAIPQGYYVDGPVDERVQFEGFYAPPGLAAPSLPFNGPELSRWMQNLDRVGQFGLMVRDENTGRVTEGLAGRPLIRYSLSNDTVGLFTRGTAVLCEMLLAGGAREVASGISGVGKVRTRGQARAIAEMRLEPKQFRPMGFHPLGTCAMGASAEVGVVDFDHCVFGTQNVFVVDGSSVPTSLGVNPQVTIMSMALRAADILTDRLS